MHKAINFIYILFVLLFYTNTFVYSSSLSNNSYKEIVLFNKQKTIYKDTVYQKIYKLYKIKKYSEALEKALIIYHDSKGKNEVYLTYKISELISEIYKKSFNYKLSLHYSNISLQNLKTHHNSINENKKIDLNLFAKSYLRLGGLYLQVYKKLKNRDNDPTYKKLLDIGVSKKYNSDYNSIKNIKIFKDSALYFFSELEQLPSINDDILINKANSHINLSAIYQLDSLYTQAEFYALKAIEIHKKRNDRIKLAKSQNNLGSVYLSIGNFNKAKKTYLNGIKSIKQDQTEKAIELKATLYSNLSWAMRNLKEYEAFDYQELSYEIKDVLREKDIRKIIRKIETNHQENIEQQKVNLVTEQRKLKEAQQSKTTLLFAALSLLVIIISGVVVYNYKLRQKNLQLKLSENNLLQQQSIEKIKSDAHTKILNATIDGKESERKQIAETLHDNVSALLSSANMHLSATKKQFKDNAPLEIEKTQAIILEASQKVRDLSHNLISSILLKFGLEYALKDAAKKYSNSQLNFKVSAHNINRYNQEFEIKVFNIIQELANNILKHSKANYAQITIKQEKNQLTILVNDDGVGFSTSSSSINDGIGLNQIEARLKMMEGKLSINSKKNKGTKISIIIPIQEQKQFKLSSVS
ncbi:ATP-binding protein [Tenacibaculum ovolyticum]|uniref:tetratricopeptide repeat-containing sensor histidine kinase n=1 Tax=Tenacibaculum ovolyticum TaxID=104270 RepID=UPI003BA8C835